MREKKKNLHQAGGGPFWLLCCHTFLLRTRRCPRAAGIDVLDGISGSGAGSREYPAYGSAGQDAAHYCDPGFP